MAITVQLPLQHNSVNIACKSQLNPVINNIWVQFFMEAYYFIFHIYLKLWNSVGRLCQIWTQKMICFYAEKETYICWIYYENVSQNFSLKSATTLHIPISIEQRSHCDISYYCRWHPGDLDKGDSLGAKTWLGLLIKAAFRSSVWQIWKSQVLK